jgi:hypothetical protein
MTCRAKRLPLLMLADVDPDEVGLGGIKLQGGAWTHPDLQDFLVRAAVQIFEGLAAPRAQEFAKNIVIEGGVKRI